MYFNRFAVPPESDSFPLIDDWVEFDKLSFLLVVIHGCDKGWNGDCDEDCEPFDPGRWAVGVVCGADFNCDWNNTGHDQDSECKVGKGLAQEFKKAGGDLL